MVELELTTGEICLLDFSDWEHVKHFRWYRSSSGYAYSSIFMHRLISPSLKHGMVVDHLNQDELDNRISNLRLVTPSQNSHNIKRLRKSLSGYVGVALTASGRWGVRIHVQRKFINVGTYDTALEAATAYNIAALHYLGEFAQLNDVGLSIEDLKELANKYKPPPSGKTSSFLGVSKHYKMWRARLTHCGVQIHSVSFKTELEAALWYDDTVRKLRGVKAVLNFPDRILT